MSSSWWASKLGANVPDRPRSPELPATPSPSAPSSSHSVSVTPENAFDAAMTWTGGEATRNSSGPCPQCGSDLYFSRSNSNSVVTQQGMAKVPPRCYSCGYTEGRPMQGMPV